ncbi:MAG: hypothetical protein AAGI25_10325 [Bacteroidota bacterium]
MRNQNSILNRNHDQIEALIESKNVSIAQLILILENVNSIELKHKTALRLHDIGDLSALSALVKEIQKDDNKNYRGTLVYSCGAFDCSEYLDFFINLIINDSTEVAMTAVLIIEEMERLKKDQITKELDRLDKILDQQKENHNKEFLEEVIQILRNKLDDF